LNSWNSTLSGHALGSFLIARVGDRSREGQRVCIKVARRELAAWSPWGDRWVLGLDIVPVDGRQAGLNRQRRDLDQNGGKAEDLDAPHVALSVRQEEEEEGGG
jgi:hypothetical protein